LVLALGIFTLNTYAQMEPRTIHLNSLMQISAEKEASYKLVLKPAPNNKFTGQIVDYMDNVKAEGEYIQIGKKYLEDGDFVFYHPNGKVESEGEYVRGVKVGTWKRYEPSGKPKADRYYPVESADAIRKSMQLEKSDEEKP
jgi:antitoxin component YwqK of YwqJK toxin-antitoxin module